MQVENALGREVEILLPIETVALIGDDQADLVLECAKRDADVAIAPGRILQPPRDFLPSSPAS